MTTQKSIHSIHYYVGDVFRPVPHNHKRLWMQSSTDAYMTGWYDIPCERLDEAADFWYEDDEDPRLIAYFSPDMEFIPTKGN